MEGGVSILKVEIIVKATKEIYGETANIYVGYGRTKLVSFSYGEPLTEEEIARFEEKTKWIVPAAFRDFLRLHNGPVLFDDPEIGGGPEILSLENIVLMNQFYKLGLRSWYPIVDLHVSVIMIDSERVRAGRDDYLIWLWKTGAIEDAQYLDIEFTVWLDRFIVTHGHDFWLWGGGRFEL